MSRLFALWLFATLEGVTSARKVTELTTHDFPYRGICGGVSVNHYRVSDFRTEHGGLLDHFGNDRSGRHACASVRW